MKHRQWLILGLLLTLVALAAVGLILTGRPDSQTSSSKRSAQAEQGALVDQKPLQTARKLAGLATTAEEQSFSQDSLRLADHEVDLAFADALHEAKEHPVQPTPEMRELSKRANHSEAAVKEDQDRVKTLTKVVAAASETNKEHAEQQLDLAQAQLAMDQDELDDAKEDLARAGGDAQSKIQRLLDEHEASQHVSEKSAPSATPDVNYGAGNLATQARAWNALREKRALLVQARQEALNGASAVVAKHEALEQHVKEEGSEREAVTQRTAGMMGSGQKSDQESKAKAAAAISSLRHFSEDQRALSALDKRIQDEEELANTYGSWVSLVEAHQRVAVHGILQSTLWILLIILVLYGFSRVLDHYFLELKPEKRQMHSLRVVARFALQAVGVLLTLFVVFGTPTQTPTILGLAGAGLTVALKDFIVAFFGWFVLMGRNGIRVGDWVEINGVGGEVVEIGLLRTVLLETGNWTDSGHPTGRRVAFVNSYAVEGHFFNFSTSGQWLWDEIQLLIQPGENPYPVIDGIQKLVSDETQANARLAEEEWQRAASQYRVKSFSAVPSINVRPTGQGIQITVRYITRAHERYDVRARLYHAMVEMLHQKHVKGAAASLPGADAERTS